MTISLKSCRLSVLTVASVFGAIAIIVAAFVIPPVRVDTSPGALPQQASTAFWVSAVLFLLLAAALFALSRRINERGMTGGLIALGILAFLLSLALLDAADAFQHHDLTMQTADTLLFISAFAGGLGSIVLFTVVFFLRKLKKGSKEAAGVSSATTKM